LIPRILIASLVCASLAAAAWIAHLPASAASAIAHSLAGERWYSLSLAGRHLGYWHTHTRRDERGNWIFESEQRFALNPLDPVSTSARRTFARHPPHPLIAAEHLQTRRSYINGVRIEQRPGGYRAVRLPEADTLPSDLNWQYTLTDYLEFELWLDRDQPQIGTSRTVATLDFERTALINRSFDIVDRDHAGYVIENAAPLSATRIRLDKHYAPLAVEIAGLFSLGLATREEALAPRSMLQSASYYIPTDRRLTDHTRISRLVLAVEGHDAPAGLFDAIRQEDGRWQLTLTSNPTTSDAVDATFLSETLQIPSRHPDVGTLAASVVAGLDGDLAKARSLTRFVHGFLSYQPGAQPQSVLGLLEDPRGDCTEFADLLTTLARNVGLPARTIFGLAYSDTGQPAFAYHAWNEMFVDGVWTAMDPTWGQERVDATHIPLPLNEAAALQLLTGTADIAFSVLEVEHFRD